MISIAFMFRGFLLMGFLSSCTELWRCIVKYEPSSCLEWLWAAWTLFWKVPARLAKGSQGFDYPLSPCHWKVWIWETSFPCLRIDFCAVQQDLLFACAFVPEMFEGILSFMRVIGTKFLIVFEVWQSGCGIYTLVMTSLLVSLQGISMIVDPVLAPGPAECVLLIWLADQDAVEPVLTTSLTHGRRVLWRKC